MGKQALDVRRVPFMGQELIAAQDSSGEVWVAIRWVCQGIGLSDGQMQRQLTNIGRDSVLSRGVAKLQLLTDGGIQDVLCLNLAYVPIWLAKIRVTPVMCRDNPDLADRLVEYQLRVKDVLAAAFLPQHAVDGDRVRMTDLELMRELGQVGPAQMPVVLEFLRLNGYNVPDVSFPLVNLVGASLSANPVRAFADEVVANVGWGLLPFKIAYGMYKSWLRGARPGTPCMGRNRFITELVCLADAGAIPGWRCPGRDVSIRPKGLMDSPEPMLARYPVDPGLLVRRLTYNGLTRI